MANEKRLIDANALKASFDERYDDAFMQSHTRPNIAWWEGYSAGVNWGRNTIADAPTVDAVEVVRCKDCIYYEETVGTDSGKPCGYGSCGCAAQIITGIIYDEDFCSYGERKYDG